MAEDAVVDMVGFDAMEASVADVGSPPVEGPAPGAPARTDDDVDEDAGPDVATPLTAVGLAKTGNPDGGPPASWLAGPPLDMLGGCRAKPRK